MNYQLCQIETTTVCNARCRMCPRPLATRSTHSEFMAETTFWAAVEQAVEVGVYQLVPFIDGEPLADKRIIDFVEQLSKRYPTLEVGWYTNGSLLTAEKSERLLKAGNIKDFNVSMQGGDKETYESTTGLPWERTISNVEKLLEINKALGSPVTVRANMCVFDATRASVPDFTKRWEAKGAKVCLGAFSNFGGLNKTDEYAGKSRMVCTRAKDHLYIFWNGELGQCCFDLVPTVTYGNVTQQRISEIIQTPKYRAMQKAHRALDVAAMPLVCQACNSNKFQG